jgi:subtilisin family serine protease
MKKEYFITCNTEEDIDKLIKELITPGLAPENTNLYDFLPITDYMGYSPNIIQIHLSEEEKEEIKNVPYVISIEEVSYENVRLNTRSRIINSTYSSANTVGHENWGMARCNSISALPPWDNNFTHHRTGSGVDVIIIDSGIIPDHPEFLDNSGNSRVIKENWSFYHPLTSNNNLNVSFNGTNFVIDGAQGDTVYVVSDKTQGTVVYRTQIYNFILDGTTTLGKPFYIGTSIGNAFNSVYVSNNGATTGTVSLTVFGADKPEYTSSQNLMYYWDGSNTARNGVITRTKYNTQNDDNLFYNDTNGHGTHCTGTVAGSAYGWATDANIYSVHINFTGDSQGYSGSSSGIIEVYSLISNWHTSKRNSSNPSISGRPSVTSNSYSWPYIITSVNDALRNMVNNGVHFIHSAGNETAFITVPTDPTFNAIRIKNNGTTGVSQETSPCWPTNSWTSQYDNPVVCVGALGDYNDNRPHTRAIYSNYGPGVSLYAPGTYIVSANYSNSTGVLYPNSNTYRSIKYNGTSMACPQVAGVLATMLQDYPNLTPLQAKIMLMQNCIVGAISGNDGLYTGSTTYYQNTRLYSLSGGQNLTLLKYPAKYIVAEPRGEQYARFMGKCYKRVEQVGLGEFSYSNLFFMNSSSDMSFGSSCP